MCVWMKIHSTKENHINDKHVTFGIKPKCCKTYMCLLCVFLCTSKSSLSWRSLPWELLQSQPLCVNVWLHFASVVSPTQIFQLSPSPYGHINISAYSPPPIIHSSSCYIYEHYFMLRLCMWKCLQAHRHITSYTIIHIL